MFRLPARPPPSTTRRRDFGEIDVYLHPVKVSRGLSVPALIRLDSPGLTSAKFDKDASWGSQGRTPIGVSDLDRLRPTRE